MLVGHSVADADGRILTMDRPMCDLLRRPERSVLGLSYADLTHPDDLTQNRRALAGLGLGEGPLKLRKRYIRADQTTVWCDIYVSRFDSGLGGRLVGTIHLASDTELDRGPASLWRAAQRMRVLMAHRREELGDDLFADHAWAILLEAYLAEAEGRLLRTAEVARDTDVSLAMTTRWLNALQAKGHVDRPALEHGIVQLTQAGLLRVERLLSATLER